MKYFVAILTAVAVFLSIVTVENISAEENNGPEGEGTTGSPYLIATLQDLKWIAEDTGRWDKHFEQTADINASDTINWNEGKGWEPIGTDEDRFTGSYDGGGHIILGLYIDRPEENNIGLFGHVGEGSGDTSVIKNLGLENVNVNGLIAVGTLIGRVTGDGGDTGTRVKNCFAVDGTVKGARAVGGLVGSFNSYQENPGQADVFRPRMVQCFADIEVKFLEEPVLNNNQISEDNQKFGGLIGCAQKGRVEDSYARGNVTGHYRVGGLLGCFDLRGVCYRSYSTGEVNGQEDVGGLIGYNDGPRNIKGESFDSFWDTQSSGIETSEDENVEGKTTEEMKNQETFKNWDFEEVWSINPEKNDGYPYLQNTTPDRSFPVENIEYVLTGEEKFKVTINNYRPDTKYQVWTYQEITSDFLIDGKSDYKLDKWTLQRTFKEGSDLSWETCENSISYEMENVLPDSLENYTVLVRKKNQGVSDIIKIFTKDNLSDAGIIRITNIWIDGKFYHKTDSAIIRETAPGNEVEIQVEDNGVENSQINVKVFQGSSTVNGTELTQTDGKWIWNISEKTPDRYTILITGTAGESKDEIRIPVILYSESDKEYAEINSATVSKVVESDNLKITIDRNINTEIGNTVYNYSIGEPWRKAEFSSSFSTDLVGNITDDTSLKKENYGIYHVISRVRRDVAKSTDDGFINTISHLREGDNEITSVTARIDESDHIVDATLEAVKGDQITFTPEAVLGDVVESDLEYSYWRRDARGWVMIRDYSDQAELTWTPARIGLYTIQVRVRGPGALSYEANRNFNVEVTGDQEEAAAVTIEEINGIDDVKPRVPVSLSAIVEGDDSEVDGLLYKYIISLGGGFLYYVETNYIPSPNYIWTPGKAGTYRVSVLVKNEISFGQYDEIKTVSVEVSD